jgi:acetyltransferase-like isoleucine patch superfamily enzyme
MIPIDRFFTHLDSFRHGGLFSGEGAVWAPLATLEASIKNLLAEAKMDGSLPEGLRFIGGESAGRRGLFVEQWIELDAPLSARGILVGAGTVLEPTAIIKSPAVIGEGCEVRQGAYFRGNVIVGDRCVIGHATEIKNSIVMDHTEAGHFNYIGDSILGSHVNLGAGSRLANLQFRTPDEMRSGNLLPIVLNIDGERVTTGLTKFGAVVGDYVEVGCNSVLCPGTLVGQKSWIYPNMTVPKSYYPPHTFFSPRKGNGKPRGS